MKRLAVLQSNYIPWKGVFDLMNRVDEFILYDTVQFTKNDWRNRNRIKTPDGVRWLTIPVKHHFGQSIEETQVAGNDWVEQHWDILRQNYCRAPHFKDYAYELEMVYGLALNAPKLSWINYLFLEWVRRKLGITTKISWSFQYQLQGDKTQRLVNLCQQVGATEYVSGPAAKNYMDEAAFERAGITVTYMDYSDYPEYPQLHPPFAHDVSVLDLLFNVGPEAPYYIWGFREQEAA